MIEPKDLVNALEEVPVCRLKLLDLARRAVKEDGSLDTDWLAFNHKEIEQASDEAESYAREVSEAIGSLQALAKGT